MSVDRKRRGAKPRKYGAFEKPQVLEKSRPIFSELLGGVQGIGFDENQRAGGEVEYLLSGRPVSQAVARNTYPVLPFLRAGQYTFWIGASLRFLAELYEKRLISASLLFFEGLETDLEKRPLMRAEWDSGDSPHAQPHWHVYPALFVNYGAQVVRGFGEGYLAPSEFTTASSFQGERVELTREKRALEPERFHYAMSTLWHSQGSNSHKVGLSDEYLLSWLQGCITYTKDQLRYISG